MNRWGICFKPLEISCPLSRTYSLLIDKHTLLLGLFVDCSSDLIIKHEHPIFVNFSSPQRYNVDEFKSIWQLTKIFGTLEVPKAYQTKNNDE